MSTSEFEVDKFEAYKVDHLFLLIGENPLPNYVAAKLLLKEGGKPYLVFSERTEKPAERLQEELSLSDRETIPLNNNEANPYEIKKRIREKVKEIQREIISQHPDKNQFGLNYTGGTKAMAAHAYQALLFPNEQDSKIQLNPPPVFSYLDSSSLKMLIDQKIGNPIPLDIPKEPLELCLEKLFRLHGLFLPGKEESKSENKKLKSNIKTEVTFPKLVEAIVKNNSQWREWCKNQLYTEGRKKEEIAITIKDNKNEIYFKLGNWENATNLRQLSLDIQELPQEIIDILKNNSFLCTEGKLSIKQIEEIQIIPKPNKSNEYPEKICKWLEGIWLEDYVLQELKKIQKEDKEKGKEDYSIDEIGMSFNFPKKLNIAEFEFDVGFLRNYQLFAISCTTDSQPGLCKFKLFEAYRRAKQLGGDEARLALVCFCNKKEKNKIKNDFLAQVYDPKIEVFGIEDIPELSESLKTWIKEVGA